MTTKSSPAALPAIKQPSYQWDDSAHSDEIKTDLADGCNAALGSSTLDLDDMGGGRGIKEHLEERFLAARANDVLQVIHYLGAESAGCPVGHDHALNAHWC